MSVRDTETSVGSEFSLREAHNLVRDLMAPNPWIYWVDFLFHIALGWIAFLSILSMPLIFPVATPRLDRRNARLLPCRYFHS